MWEVVSGMFTLGKQQGMDYSTKLWQGMSEPQKPAWKACAGSLMAEMKQNLYCGHLDSKTCSNTAQTLASA